MNRLAIFDCDGTLVDSQGNIRMAMDEAFMAAKLTPPPPDATRRITGLSLPEAMKALLPGGKATLHDELVNHFKTAFFAMRSTGAVHEPLYDGIVELIKTLDAEGWLLGVATGKSDRGLTNVLATHDLAGHFVTLHTADRHPSKPHPSMIEACMADTGAAPETTAMIGDTSYDMAMARAAGVMAIGVGWGYHPPLELTAAGADIVVDRPGDIAAILKDFGPQEPA